MSAFLGRQGYRPLLNAVIEEVEASKKQFKAVLLEFPFDEWNELVMEAYAVNPDGKFLDEIRLGLGPPHNGVIVCKCDNKEIK